MTRKLRPKGRNLAVIAREVALIRSSVSFTPKEDHTPGVAHSLADALSRATSIDDNDLNTHCALANATRVVPLERNKEWYRALKLRPLNSVSTR